MRAALQYLRSRPFTFWLRAACALVVLLALGVLAAPQVLPQPLTYRLDDPAFNRAFWKQEIAHKGGAVAHDEFKQVMADKTPGVQHLSSHVFGSLLAEKYGPDGIRYCDSEYSFGCYHGFLAEAISSGGLALIPKLDDACTKAFGIQGTGCTHGIGHGILEYVGYGKLNDALALCDQTTVYARMLGCTAGVFMEYYFPLSGTLTNGNPRVRPFDPAHPDAPCGEVSATYKDQCYFALGLYVRESFADPQTTAHVCAALDDRSRQYCFLGLGAAQTLYDKYDVRSVRAVCGTLPARDEFSCRAGAWWQFTDDTPAHRSLAPQMCAYPDPMHSLQCRAFGDLAEGRPVTQYTI